MEFADVVRRSTLLAHLAFQVVVLLCSNRTTTSTVLVAKVSTTIRSKAGCFTTITSTRTSGTLMVRSSSAGTRSLGTMDGRRCRSVAKPASYIVSRYFFHDTVMRSNRAGILRQSACRSISGDISSSEAGVRRSPTQDIST
jgi:hypothetical protein